MAVLRRVPGEGDHHAAVGSLAYALRAHPRDHAVAGIARRGRHRARRGDAPAVGLVHAPRDLRHGRGPRAARAHAGAGVAAYLPPAAWLELGGGPVHPRLLDASPAPVAAEVT